MSPETGVVSRPLRWPLACPWRHRRRGLLSFAIRHRGVATANGSRRHPPGGPLPPRPGGFPARPATCRRPRPPAADSRPADITIIRGTIHCMVGLLWGLSVVFHGIPQQQRLRPIDRAAGRTPGPQPVTPRSPSICRMYPCSRWTTSRCAAATSVVSPMSASRLKSFGAKGLGEGLPRAVDAVFDLLRDGQLPGPLRTASSRMPLK